MDKKTASQEDYLRAIYHFFEEGKRVRSVDVAEYLKVSKPSVAEMISSLAKRGFIAKNRYSSIKLTKKGAEEARKITNKHRIIEVFLTEFLKMEKKNLHEEAHRLEHAFSDNVVKRLGVLLKKPKKCPHGKPIMR